MRRLGLGSAFFAAILLCGRLAGASEARSAPIYQGLAEKFVGADQGVFVRAEDGTILASLAAARVVHPASVSKVATTLVVLEQWGPNHRFVTRLSGPRPRKGGIPGDLEVAASGDPFFLPDAGALLLTQFQAMGVQRIAGSLRVRGPLYFDWQSDPRGTRLRGALEGKIAASVWERLGRVPGRDGSIEERPGGLIFEGRAQHPHGDRETLMVHSSPPLFRILKELNSYSNNIFHSFSDQIGGPALVEKKARGRLPASWRDEVRITNAAGAGKTNRMSPRAAVGLLDALARDLGERGLGLVDVLPVAGVDRGTLENRFRAAHLRGTLVGKTGSYGSLQVSSLAGVLRTKRFGRVSFAILNHGLPVAEARRRQDAFLEALLGNAGALRWEYEPRPSPLLVEEIVVREGGGD